ncbi:MAG: hypothetical protein ABI182_07275 [Candidatus Baltobacteraceae bacterium]
MDKLACERIGAEFEALFLNRMLSPMSRTFGQFGEMVVDTGARSIAQHDTHGFGNLIAEYLERPR